MPRMDDRSSMNVGTTLRHDAPPVLATSFGAFGFDVVFTRPSIRRVGLHAPEVKGARRRDANRIDYRRRDGSSASLATVRRPAALDLDPVGA
jgi:hypothetical protein